jgi:hypothetical protein
MQHLLQNKIEDQELKDENFERYLRGEEVINTKLKM